MIEELRQVDDSVLTSLIELRGERDALRQRLARMQDAAADVSEKVLARVRGDYETRIAALDGKAAPLKEAARAAYSQLTPLLDRAREACETLRLDHEELELRHRLGEYDDDEHRDKSAQLDADRRAADERAAEISAFVARFQGAFDSPDELGTPAPNDIPAVAGSPVATGAIPGTGVPRDEEGTLMLPPEPPPAPEPPPMSTSEPPVWRPAASWRDAGSATAAPEEPWRAAAPLLDELAPPAPEDAGSHHTAPLSPVPAAPGPAAAGPAASAAGGSAHEADTELEPEAATTGLKAQQEPVPAARLEALDGDLEPQPHYLEPLTFIGRTPENQIRIYKPAVSRRHAQITETDAGWMLRDLSSENGTYVNGQRITERLLADGDRVQFGTSRFVLRLTT